jgi:hypothetical protein
LNSSFDFINWFHSFIHSFPFLRIRPWRHGIRSKVNPDRIGIIYVPCQPQ